MLLPLLILVNIIIEPVLLIFIVLLRAIVILFSVQNSAKLILSFILIYSILLMGIIFSINIRRNSSFYQIERLDNFSKVIFIFMFMSLGSLPPLLGFLAKLLVLKTIILTVRLPAIILLVFTSLIILYTYISRFFFYLSIIPSIKLRLKANKFKYAKLIFLASIFMFNLLIILYTYISRFFFLFKYNT